MPSGPKRRKKAAAAAAAAAAKRKEEDEVGISRATHQQEIEEKGEMESSDDAKDVSIEVVKPKEEGPSVSERSHEVLLDKVEASEGAEAKEDVGFVSESSHEILLEKVEASEGAEAKEEVASVPERPTEILLEKVSEERVEEAKEEVGGAGLGGENLVVERSAEIVLQEVQSGEESVAHVTEEEGVEASEVPVSVPADSALSEGEGEGEGEESREMPHMGTVIMSSASAVPVPAALSEQRASVWNCCGLLDVFKGSQR